MYKYFQVSIMVYSCWNTVLFHGYRIADNCLTISVCEDLVKVAIAGITMIPFAIKVNLTAFNLNFFPSVMLWLFSFGLMRKFGLKLVGRKHSLMAEA